MLAGAHLVSDAPSNINTMLAVTFGLGINWPQSLGTQLWLYNWMLSPPTFFAAEYIASKESIVSADPPKAKQNKDSGLNAISQDQNWPRPS